MPNITKRILLCLARMNEASEEMRFIKETFCTNWGAPLGLNVNGFEVALQGD